MLAALADLAVSETWSMAASLLARDAERDLCLLFVSELSKPPAAPLVRMGAAKSLSVGEEVYAVGAPKGLELSLSRGVVSQLRTCPSLECHRRGAGNSGEFRGRDENRNGH